MSEYTPTTETVRNGYVGAGSELNPYVLVYERADFDRWLAEEKAKAWQKGADHGYYAECSEPQCNPYREGREVSD